ncbi:class I SAM-dependent rRNA methyltransferase [Chitinophaga nivalis]|uniref:Class I SAM-dependent rRNA methyltransferase n=1 Tax=Chitinophaga nivalis TaxID=2991709 RepID=A0ABT3ISI9_9BACT|nr:class I SAM-dependent rRNA methyltransferase [Chitinophaga nivalis]MCW3463363.1 class I SAM-dependent rRNA methyltransferase [Chitinophaga nivalis]MCW3486947.1 class I SAM-dependent rRNA methyltransferase [Chitinophaga nivalis]
MTKVFLKKQIQNRVLQGHPWIFGNEVSEIKGDVNPGDIVDVYTHKGFFLGRGYINPQSQILVRILTRDKSEEINAEFFYRRLLKCWEYRQKLGYVENCRLVYGEADELPALVIDKFNDYFVIQTLALGIEKWKDAIVDAINRIFSPKGIYERNDVPVRELEGMTQQKGFLSAPFDTNVIINENGLQFHVDIVNGQKTGYFLDQQDNRREIKNIVRGADVMEAFCYTGTFSCHAGYYGAKSVLGLDISEHAVETARKNAALNNLQDICKFQAVNAFDQLKQWSREEKKFDVVILDPPAFTKSRENIQKAVTGYKEINLRGMKLLKPGGFLVTASCTNLVSPSLFLETIDAAAKDAKKKLRQVTFQTQAQDHPILRNIENTTYLKFLIVEVS